MKAKKCFKHKGRKAFDEWRICADGPWRGICKECDVELNRIGLKWAFPRTWKTRLARYKERIGA